MTLLAEAPPKGRCVARPDPLPRPVLSLAARHGPWITALGAGLGAIYLFDRPSLGRLACGAATMAILANATQGRLRRTCHALHLSAGILLLAVWHGAAAAGAYFPAAGMLVVGALLARGAALGVRAEVAPLAAVVPWKFRRTYRRAAIPFALAGLVASAAVVLAGTAPAVRIAGVALFPMALRSYAGTLLSRREMRAIWGYGVAIHLMLLGLLVPGHGAAAAAWALVIAETILFGGSALVIARRTGVAPLPLLPAAVAVMVAAMFGATTIPDSPELPFLAAVLIGAAAGAAFFPRRVKT